ncbi:BZ3500_MvSof-1268-A1-R1_Chr1-3g02174 [Microbotryum saponariae]|uniref:Maintenance of mitochondrial morphology protein 1 n=1 Tax=Microbotryum saponariae TaxID=289078 RepID=A0A2X0MMN5_9BASI|nr:BZ3500_MvSof-1268-A1-R1_Chr1-3g02174 [Microbotryum saponariae]SCZ95570.1 BZ3501_MvSof-1269-A2-R1_Chr1-3g01777 [Microbotryum saponariae]
MADTISSAAFSMPSGSASGSIRGDPAPLSASAVAAPSAPSAPSAAWRAIDCNCAPRPRWSFTQGFLLGQFSILLLVALFLKYVVFEHRPPSTAPRSTTTRSKRRTATSATSSTPSSSALASASTSQILSSLAYDLSSHAPETLDWLNVLLGQTLSAYRGLIFSSPQGPKGLFESILNRSSANPAEKGLVSVDYISVDDVHVGQAYPLLGDARVRPSGAEGGAVRVEFDIDYVDQVSLSISTSVLFNFPRPSFAVLPVSLGLTLERFSGTLSIEVPSPTSNHPNPSLHLSLHPDFELHLSTTSLLGARAKLHDVPKIEQLIRERLRSSIVEKVVWPGRVSIALPAPIAPPLADDVANASTSSSSSALGENDLENGFDDFPSNISTLNPFLSDQEDLSLDEQDDDAPLIKSDQSPSKRPSFPGAPVVDLENPKGPSVLLHPRLDRKTSRLSTANNSPTKKKATTNATTLGDTTSPTKRNNLHPSAGLPLGASSRGAASGSGSALPSPSPTESLPGYFGSFNTDGIRQRGHPSTASASFVGSSRNRNAATSVLERR